MTKIAISPWRRKVNRVRYYVTDGHEPIGVIFESKGIFSAVDSNGNLVAASTAFQIAANALVPATGVSS
jgi:hypothetical protein